MAKTSLIVFSAAIVGKLLSYIYRIIIARQFGPEIYGFYSIAFMIFGLFAMFSLLGIPEGIVRYISYYRGTGNKRRIKKIFSFSIKIFFITGILSAIIMFFSSEFLAIQIFHDSNLIIFFKLFSLSLPFFVISRVFIGTIRAFEKIPANALVESIIEPITKIFTITLLILLGLNYSNSISFSFILGSFMTLLLSYLFCKNYLSKFFINYPKEENKKTTKELLKYSLPLLFSSVIIFIFGWADTFLIGYLKTANEVGIYNAALPVALMLTFTPLLFTQLFFPLINKEYSRKRIDIIRELSKQVGKWIFIINLPVLFIFLLFPGTIINILFGSKYLAGASALSFLSIGFFILAQTEISLNLLGMIKKSKLRLFNITLSLIIAIILNFYLIPKERILFIENPTGIIGAAIATTLSLFFYCFLIISQGYYYLKIIPLRRKMIGVLISCLIAGTVLLTLRRFIEINVLTLISLGILFLLIYVLLIFLTKSLDKNDLMVINTFKRRLSKIPLKHHSLG